MKAGKELSGYKPAGDNRDIGTDRVLRAAIVGMGKVGRTRYSVIEGMDKMEVVALCDVDEEITREFSHCDFDADYRNIINRDDIDVVFVANTLQR